MSASGRKKETPVLRRSYSTTSITDIDAKKETTIGSALAAEAAAAADSAGQRGQAASKLEAGEAVEAAYAEPATSDRQSEGVRFSVVLV